jgi:carbonic anhydrase/acetyltransferase-like protein (isoleucine patch superfamily)
MFFSYKGIKPVLGDNSYVHPQATVTGNVVIGRNVYIGPSAAIRGDFGKIIIEDGCNVQENCTIHMFPGVTVILEENAHIGHGAIIHGARIGRDVLVGMNAVVMDDAIVGDGSIIGALAFVPSGMEIPSRSLVVGNPAKIIKQVSDEMLEWKKAGTKIYQGLANQADTDLHSCDPLREGSIQDTTEFMKEFESWNRKK